jgi:dihydroxyacid dehydratase/phosphogluconate dehydratase
MEGKPAWRVPRRCATTLYRNLLAMDAEELLRGHPVDGVVLIGGCDKTTPALLLGATSMNIPAIYLPAGPMLRGSRVYRRPQARSMSSCVFTCNSWL